MFEDRVSHANTAQLRVYHKISKPYFGCNNLSQWWIRKRKSPYDKNRFKHARFNLRKKQVKWLKNEQVISINYCAISGQNWQQIRHRKIIFWVFPSFYSKKSVIMSLFSFSIDLSSAVFLAQILDFFNVHKMLKFWTKMKVIPGDVFQLYSGDDLMFQLRRSRHHVI